MAKTVKMITVLDKDQAVDLGSNKRVTGVDTMPQVDKRIKEFIRNYIAKNVGYEDPPIAGLSKIDGGPVELRKVGTSVTTYVPGKSGTVLLEVHMPEDMIVSVPYGKLLELSSELARADEDFEIEMIMEDLEEIMVVGVPETDSEEAISFVSFIDVSKCKFLAIIDKDWQTEDFNIPGIEKINLASMSMF